LYATGLKSAITVTTIATLSHLKLISAHKIRIHIIEARLTSWTLTVFST